MRRRGLFALLLALLPGTGAAQTPPKPDPLALGKQYTAWFYAGEIDKLWERFSPELKKALTSVDNLRAFRGQVEAQLGAETSIVEETVTPVELSQVYMRKAKFAKVPMTIIVQWTLSGDGTVTGFFGRPDHDPGEVGLGS